MGVIRIVLAARKAIKWLKVAQRLWSPYMSLAEATKLGRKVNRAFAFIERVEAKQGAHTKFWSKFEKGDKTNTVPDVTLADVRYIVAFKKGFDKLKP